MWIMEARGTFLNYEIKIISGVIFYDYLFGIEMITFRSVFISAFFCIL